LTGCELYTVAGIADTLKPAGTVAVRASDGDKLTEFEALVRIDTPEELVAFRNGGILPYVLRQLVGKQ
jgi:aconitate hydratase